MDDRRAVPMGSLGMGSGSVTNEVLAVVTHDLRNPLNIISVGTSLLDGGDQSEADRAEILRAIKRATDRMERLLADLLALTTVEGGRPLPVLPAQMDIVALVNEVRDGFSRPASTQGRRLQCRVPDALPAVHADRERIHQVLANLVGNALKFTPREGTITLEAGLAKDRVRCSVSDTGPGMTKKERDRLFDPFWQAEKTARLGFGLGLKIAKCIIEAHGSALHVDSVPGSGSTFWFMLPVANGHSR